MSSGARDRYEGEESGRIGNQEKKFDKKKKPNIEEKAKEKRTTHKGNKREKNFDLAIFLKEQSSDGVQIRNVLKKGKRK